MRFNRQSELNRQVSQKGNLNRVIIVRSVSLKDALIRKRFRFHNYSPIYIYIYIYIYNVIKCLINVFSYLVELWLGLFWWFENKFLVDASLLIKLFNVTNMGDLINIKFSK